MHVKRRLTTPATDIIALLPLLLSIAIILPIYYHVPFVITPELMAIYDAMGVDLNAFTAFTYLEARQDELI